MAFFILAFGATGAQAQTRSVRDILGVSAAVRSLDVDSLAAPLGTAAKAAVTTVALANGSVMQARPAHSVTVNLAPAIASTTATATSAAAAANSVQTTLSSMPRLRAMIPAGWAPASMADLSTMLSYLVTAASVNTTPLDPELNCLATAVYFESRGEPLEGQLAVANVVINRATSGRYPPDWCSVVKQPYQFSFVRGGQFPSVDTGCAAWIRAEAVARIAASHVLTALPSDVLWYHADYVAPRWQNNLDEVEQIGAHIFYRS